MSTKTTSALVTDEEARRRARKLGEEMEVDAALRAYSAQRWDASGSTWPTLHLDDVSGIPFLVDVAGIEEYQHRGRLRAGDGDIYATITAAATGYERYCQDVLRLGAPEHLVAKPLGPPIAVANACSTGATYHRLVEVAKASVGFAVHPYMGIEDVWTLANKLSFDAGVPVRVLAPPPPVTWIANDKAVFDDLVTCVLGSDALVATLTATDPATIASNLQSLTADYERVGLKRTRCASAMGNAVFPASAVATLDEATANVNAFLNRTEWPGDEPVLAVAWHDTDLSPSTQLWIPPNGQGVPRLDGVYEQILAGEEKVFVGSRPSTLPERLNRTLGEQALRVGGALQELGYVGRCSFDHLVEGDPHGAFRVLFTECNGRWGGTSMPMSLIDRLISAPRPPYRAQDVVFPHLVGSDFAEVLRRVGADAFDATTGQGRFLFYNLGPLHDHGKFDVISIGVDQADAETGMLERLPELLGA